MNVKADQLPDDVKELKNFCMKLIDKNNKLEHALQLAGHQRYSARSEMWIHPGMKSLFPGASEAKAKAEPKDNDKNKAKPVGKGRSKKQQFPPEIPREEIRLEIHPDERTCHKCNSTKELKKTFEQVIEKLHYEPAKITIKRYIKESYSCQDCESMRVARMPDHPLPKISATVGSLATIAVSKYCDSQPLYRQEQILYRSGISIPRDVMARWMIQISGKLEPIYDEMHRRQIESKVMLIDETGLQVLKEPGRKAHNKSFLVCKVREGPPHQNIVLFHYSPSRSAESIASLIDGFGGVLLSDGLKVYDTLAGERPSIVHCGCWSHARRKFVDAAKSVKPAERKTQRADEMIEMINELFRIERQITGEGLDEVSKRRKSESQLVLNRIKSWLDVEIEKTPKRSPLGGAMNYLVEQWQKLVRFIDYPNVPIHNNTTEGQIRPVALGRKNFLFCNSVAGAKATAILYSLISTAKLNEMNPHHYLIRALEGVAASKPAHELLPLQI